MIPELPNWAVEMRDLFKSGSVAQFIIHGNVFDVVPATGPSGPRLLSLRAFLEEVMFEKYDTVLQYDRGKGIRATRGADDWADWLKQALGDQASTIGQTREPGPAMELIDRYLLRTLNLQSIRGKESGSRRIAVILDFAEFVVPRGDPIQLGGAFSSNVDKVLAWANDTAILQSNIVTVLLTEGLHDLNELVAQNPHARTLRIPLPAEPE